MGNNLEDIEKSIEENLPDSVLNKAVEKTPVTVEQPVEETPKVEEVKPEEQVQVEEPEFDLGDGRKAKLSEIKEWEQGNLRQSDYTKKTQALAKEKEDLKQLVDFKNYLQQNPNKAQQIVEILNKKEEIKKQEEVVEDLDPSDPMYQYANNQITALKGEIESLKKANQEAEQRKQVETAQDTLNSTLADSTKDYTFSSDVDKEHHRSLVLSYLKDNPRQYTSQEDFMQTIRDTSSLYYDKMKQAREAYIKQYLETKKTPVPSTEQVTTKATPAQAKSFSIESLQEDIERELDLLNKKE